MFLHAVQTFSETSIWADYSENFSSLTWGEVWIVESGKKFRWLITTFTNHFVTKRVWNAILSFLNFRFQFRPFLSGKR